MNDKYVEHEAGTGQVDPKLDALNTLHDELAESCRQLGELRQELKAKHAEAKGRYAAVAAQLKKERKALQIFASLTAEERDKMRELLG